MKIEGGCHCGFLAYEGEADPERVMICNCTDCQSLSGSAFRTVVPVPEPSFRFLSGVPTVYVKTGESGTRREQTFCPKCGSPIYSASEGANPRELMIRVGSSRQRHQLVPTTKLWRRSQVPWLDRIADIPGVEEQ